MVCITLCFYRAQHIQSNEGDWLHNLSYAHLVGQWKCSSVLDSSPFVYMYRTLIMRSQSVAMGKLAGFFFFNFWRYRIQWLCKFCDRVGVWYICLKIMSDFPGKFENDTIKAIKLLRTSEWRAVKRIITATLLKHVQYDVCAESYLYPGKLVCLGKKKETTRRILWTVNLLDWKMSSSLSYCALATRNKNRALTYKQMKQSLVCCSLLYQGISAFGHQLKPLYGICLDPIWA